LELGVHTSELPDSYVMVACGLSCVITVVPAMMPPATMQELTNESKAQQPERESISRQRMIFFMMPSFWGVFYFKAGDMSSAESISQGRPDERGRKREEKETSSRECSGGSGGD